MATRSSHLVGCLVLLALGCSDQPATLNRVDAPGVGGAVDGGGQQLPATDGGSTSPGKEAGADAPSSNEGGPSNDGSVEGSHPTLGGCKMLPDDSMWNTEISQAPVHALSSQYIANMGAGSGLMGNAPVHPDFGEGTNGIPYVLVPASQATVPITFDASGDESDPGPYPIPLNAPIEDGGDLHVLALETGSCTLYELYTSRQVGNGWTAGSGAIWHLNKNEQRPDGWTSADAAGLPILPGLVRYDEVFEKKDIRHALRVTADRVQSAYIYPATHSDGVYGHDPNFPPMGLRLRLKAGFDVSGYPEPVQVILRAMKTYGLVVADTGGDWYVSGVPDNRWKDSVLRELEKVKGSDFEAVDTGAVHPY